MPADTTDVSPILALPYIQPGQAQKHVTHNEALRRLDVLVQLAVESFGAETPPTAPSEGAVQALGGAPTGAWAGQAGMLAVWADGVWTFLAPQAGWRAFGRAEAELRLWDGAAWVLPPARTDDLDGLGIGTAADATNRLAVKSAATLLSHDGAGHQVKINKAAAGDTASVLFQSGWTGHAEIGLAGGTDLSVKVSGDGSAWTEALRIDGAGRVGVGTTSPDDMLHVAGNTSGNVGARVMNAGTGSARLRLTGNNGAEDFIIYTASGRLALWDGTAERVSFAEGGSVGIGTASPAGRLHVFSGSSGATPNSGADEIVAEGSGNSGVSILSGPTSAGYLMFANSTADHAASISYNHSNNGMSFRVNQTTRMVIASDGSVGIGTTSPDSRLRVTQNSTSATSAVVENDNAAMSGNAVLSVDSATAAGSGFDLFRGYSGSFGDLEFRLRGDGNTLCDGSFTGGGADYAEYFEWADGNPTGEDRRGLSVVLAGDKIAPAQPDDEPFGVVSANPSVVGDGDMDRWKGKYLRDAFGSYVMEDYEVVEWVKTILAVDDEVRSYAADAVPDGVTVPKDASRTVQQRRKLNPAWDPNHPYTPRAERPEWATVGLMGKLRLRKGQPVGPRWVRMREVSATVEEWLVR